MKINVEKGRMFGVSWPWIHFVLTNTDIMTALNHAPLVLEQIEQRKFRGKIWGVSVALEVVVDSKPDPKDEVHVVADVRMPFGLGRTHTIAHYRYASVDISTTMVDLNFTVETTGPFMAIYAILLKRRIDDYLNNVMSHNERAGVLMQEGSKSLMEFLSSMQIKRVEAYRSSLDKIVATKIPDDPPLVLQDLDDRRAWHPELIELTTLYEKFQGREKHLEDELIRIRETRDAVATLLVARRMLEVIVTHVCEEQLNRPRGSEPLARLLDKISNESILPEYVLTSMQNLNRLSTYGAHPKDFSPRQVREALMALCSIMEWYVSSSIQMNSKTGSAETKSDR